MNLRVWIPAWVVPVLLLVSCSSPTLAPAPATPSPKQYALERLRAAGASQELLSFLEETPITEDRDRIVQLNVLGFLGTADYSGHYSRAAVRKSVEFMRKHRKALREAEKRFGVPGELITALLWVETKLGTRLGSHNVARVYFSLVQADHPDVVRSTLATLSTRKLAAASGTLLAPGDLERKAMERSSSKANWALQELQSIDEIRKRGLLDIRQLSGSYAGAFGIPQFIPSSYLRWSWPSAGASADLHSVPDAIHSVAHYLQANGWRKRDPASQHASLHHYNRADGYVKVIQRLAAEIRKARRST